jgi:peptidyl-prolyl cis-trans isomerase SDCCAG10
MANLTVYANQPATKGKVVLHTTIGPFDVELWSKEAPLACRNFVQLCMEGYYDGCIFHRVIKDFMAQTGDPTGTGTGGASVYEEGGPEGAGPQGVFKDEFNGRLRFIHRGLLGMASNGPHTNGSQFFVTLSNCEWLDKKHTIFGKITGNSLYNVNRFGELECDSKDRPTYPPRIQRTEILLDPFDDIVPREKVVAVDAVAKRPKRKEKKNLSLLSFGEEAAEEERDLSKVQSRVQSSHDVLEDPRLSSQQVSG